MTKAKFKAVLLGLACGDALGAPTEFKSIGAIQDKYGPQGIQSIIQTSGRFTDDTQMTVALAEGLLDAHASVDGMPHHDVVLAMGSSDHTMPFVAKQYVRWAFGPKNNRAPGNTCMSGCSALKHGADWKNSGVKSSKGCGSAMRSSPVGLVYSDLKTLGRIARDSSVITHGHQAALDSAHAAALIVRLLIDGADPEDLLDAVRPVVEDENFLLLLDRVAPFVVETIAGEVEPTQVQTFQDGFGLGESWVGDEAVASALYCFLLAVERKEGYVETVRYGANTKGDSDSIAAIAGSFAGAFWGLGGEKGIPQDWIDHVEDGAELEDLGDRLYALHLDLAGQPIASNEG